MKKRYTIIIFLLLNFTLVSFGSEVMEIRDKALATAMKIVSMKRQHFTLPDTTWNPLQETKSSNIKNINAKLEELRELLALNERTLIRKKIMLDKKKITEFEKQIVTYKEKFLTAPEIVPFWKKLIESPKSYYRDKIKETEHNIKRLKSRIENNLKSLAKLLRKSGVKISEDQLQLMLQGVSNSDLDFVRATFENIVLINNTIAKEMKNSKGNRQIVETYYHVHVILLEVYLSAFKEFVRKTNEDYKYTLDNIEQKVKILIENAHNAFKSNPSTSTKKTYQNNLNTLAKVTEAVSISRKIIAQQKEWALKHIPKIEERLQAAKHTLQTAKVVNNMLVHIETSMKDFNALAKMNPPPMIQFEDKALAEALLRYQPLILKK